MFRRTLLSIVLACAFSPLALAEDDIFKTTTEFGVTVTTVELIDAIQETQDFWYPVRMYVASDKFAVSDPATRKQAAEFIRRVNNQLADQLFSRDDESSLDLIRYLGTRLRLFATYRELRSSVEDDHLTMSIKENWEDQLRAAHLRDVSGRPAALLAARNQVQEHLQSVGVTGEPHQYCLALWDRAAQLWSRLHDSQAGQIMLQYEREVEQCDPQLYALVHDVVSAADWAQITKSRQRLLKRADFEQAWADLKRYRGERTVLRATE